MNCQISHGNIREIASLVLCPVFATIDRDPQAEFCSNKQKVAVDNVLLHHVRIPSHTAVWANQLYPGVAEVSGLVNIKTHVTEGVKVKSRESSARLIMPWLHRGHPRVGWQTLDVADDIFPVLTSIAS